MKKSVLISVLCCLLLNLRLQAQNIIYVNAAATGANNGSSWANAFTDFQAGVNAATAGDSVFVAGGTYQPTAGQSFSMKEGVKIYGGFKGTEVHLYQRNLSAGDTSFLKGNGNSVIRNDGNGLTPSAVLDGFTITGGDTPNTLLGGGGMYNNSASPTIVNCIFSRNTGINGGGMLDTYKCFPIVINCTFSDNIATDEGAGIFCAHQTYITLINCTFWGNQARSDGACCYIDEPLSTLTNCVVYGNSGGIQGVNLPTITYSLVQGMQADSASHNLDGSIDPKFMDPENGNFQLQAGSPAINRGNNDSLPAGDTTDIVGNPRIYDKANGGIVDIGAYEYQGNPLAIHPDVSGILYVDSSDVNNSFADGSSWQKALPQLADALRAADTLNKHTPGTVKQIWVAKGTYSPLYKVAEQYNNGTATSNRDKSFVLAKNVQVYGGFAGNETSLNQRNDALIYTVNSTILTGILHGGDTAYHVLLSAGDMGNALIDGFTITGGNANLLSSTSAGAAPEYPMDTLKVNGEEVINFRGGGLFVVNSSPTLSHLIIQSNKGMLGGGLYNGKASSPKISRVTICWDTAATGGGVCNFYASPEFSKVTIRNNRSQSGGGIANLYGAPVFTDVVVTRNSSGQAGGGVTNGESAAVFTNTTIVDNTGQVGGGMANSVCSPVFTNITISGNTAEYGGALYNGNQSNPVLRNSIVLGNMNTKDARSVYSDNTSSVTYNYSLIDSVYYKKNKPRDTIRKSKNTIFNDPATGDYTLKSNSWVINKGDNDYYSEDSIPDISADSTDLAGNLRIYNRANGGVVDLGAYEYQGNLVHPDDDGILYVDSSDVNNSYADGSSWTSALPYLSEAIAFADTNTAVKEIHVANGTYFPTGTQGDANRDSTFLVTRTGLKIIGGYPTGLSRSGAKGSTILSGDIGTSGDNADNSYHVMVISNIGSSSDSLVIKGITFAKGNADGSDTVFYNGQRVAQNIGGGLVIDSVAGTGKIFFDSCQFLKNDAGHGGGMFDTKTSSVFYGCTFSDNHSDANAASNGGGLENGEASSSTFINCKIAGNQAPMGGGVMNKVNSSSTFINCSITGNNALSGGGVMNSYASTSSSFINCTISGNNAGQPMERGAGGGIEGTGASCTLVNCIIWGNSGGIDGTPTVTYSLVQGWTSGGTGNLPDTTDPQFTNDPSYTTAPFTAGNYQLKAGSPTINGGNTAALPAGDTTDLAGNSRIYNNANGGIVDMGAYEYQGNPEPPIITSQPTDTAVCNNSPAAFAVIATGTNVSYQWQFSADGTTWNDAPDGHSDSLKLTNVTHADSGHLYRVVLSNAFGTDTSQSAVLSVILSPNIRLQPRNRTVCTRSDVSFSVQATGINLHYQWQKKLSARRQLLNYISNLLSGSSPSPANQTRWSNIPNATGAVLSLTGLTDNDNNNQYRVVITGSCSTVNSKPVTLIVNADATVALQPRNQTVTPGSDANFTVIATGRGTLSYQWQISTDAGTTWTNIPGATQSLLSIFNASETDDGNQYRVVVTGGCNQLVSHSARLSVSERINPLQQILNNIWNGLLNIQLPGNFWRMQPQQDMTATPPKPETGPSHNYVVYPNPVTHSTLTVRDQSGQALGYISLYNISGQRVLQTHSDNSQITVQLHDVMPGIYVLEIIDKHQHTYSTKIIVQNEGTTFK